MNIDHYAPVINACRFCFMCRHLAAVGNVTFSIAVAAFTAGVIEGFIEYVVSQN